MTSGFRITVDRGVCIGAGECVRLAPAAYDVDDEGLAFVKDDTAVDLELARKSAKLCPSQAIRILESNGKERT